MKVIMKWIEIYILLVLATFLIYVLYLHNNNALYVKQDSLYGLETKENFLGYYDSKEEALRQNNIEIDKEWDIDDSIYILDICEDEGGLHDLNLYKLYKENNNIALVVTPNQMDAVNGYHQIDYDRDWYDTYIIEDIMDIRTFYKSMIIGNGDNPDIYYGLWLGEGIDQLQFAKGEFNYEWIHDNEYGDYYFWTYEISDSNELLADIGEEVLYIDRNGIEKPDCYEYKACDVKKVLGINYDSHVTMRAIIFMVVICISVILSITLTIVFIRKFRDYETISKNMIICWVVNDGLWVLSEVLILTYIYNPVLTFGW